MDLFTAAKNVSIVDIYNFYANGNKKKGKIGRKSVAVSCPFHEDKHPSLNLYPNNSFYCFSCKKGGSNIDLVMEILKTNAITAAKTICKDFNIEYEERHSVYAKNDAAAAEKKGLIESNTILANFFHSHLSKAPNPKYFEDRGIGSLVDGYLLGYCPEGKIFNDVQRAVDQGLGNEKGECIFAGRYIVPIKNIHGVIIGFIGRLPDDKVDENHPKYINSCNSSVFRKREVLFNSSSLLDKTDNVLVVEGVFDALSYIAAGVTNVISPLGCSLSDEHLKTLRRFSQKTIILSFDRDEAGTLASKKALFYAKGLRLGVAVSDFKGCKDVNELLISEGPEYVAGSTQFLSAPEYVIKSFQDSKTLNTLPGREKLWTSLAKIIGYRGREKTFPINEAYSEPAIDYYWSLYEQVVAANPIS